MKYSTLLLLVSIFFFTPAFAQNYSLLWKISGKNLNSPSYLYGTIHMICEKDFIVTEPVRSAFNQTLQVYLEMDMDNPNLEAEIQKHIKIPNGQTLESAINKEDYQLLDRFFKDSLGVNINYLKETKPLLLFSMVLTKMMNNCPIKSFEQTFSDMAHEQKKEVLGLETVAEQMNVIDKIPINKQAEDLVESIKKYTEFQTYFSKLIEAYKKQDLDQLDQYMKDPKFGSSEFEEEVLIVDRNKNWVQQIASIAGQKATFFAVGAGHLNGNQGLIQLLKNEGYLVEPVF